MVRRIVAAAALGLALYACKEDLEKPPPAGDPGTNQPLPPSGSGSPVPEGGTLTDGSTDFDAGACTDLALTSVVRDETAVPGDPIADTGGTINDGTYDLNTVEIYVGGSSLPGPTGNTFRNTLRITGGTTFERVSVRGSQDTGGATLETRGRGVIAAIGTSATISLSCPTSTQEQYAYTATDTTLTFTNVATKQRWSYTRAP